MLSRKILTYAACLWLFSAYPAFTAPAPTKIVVGYAAINGRVAPLWIAAEQGFLAKYGLQSEQVYVRGAPLLVAGMASGDIQFTRSGGSATLAAVGAGHDFKIVATFSSRNT
jgi:ABC-type nitrate/sulfonate/bicarbonate transport system substrate-binding protein